jgi:hypothetical protein
VLGWLEPVHVRKHDETALGPRLSLHSAEVFFISAVFGRRPISISHCYLCSDCHKVGATVEVSE